MSSITCAFCGRELPAAPESGPPVCLRCRNSKLPEHLRKLRTNFLEIDRLAPDLSPRDESTDDEDEAPSN